MRQVPGFIIRSSAEFKSHSQSGPEFNPYFIKGVHEK